MNKKIQNLYKLKDIDNFINYLKNYIFKLSPEIYNYSKLITYFKNNNKN